MEYQQASPATTFSKKLTHGGGLTRKHEYDGVFGGPVKPGSRMQDYREIFGGSTTCSIPILDFPELKESNISMEARSLEPDYSMIFGGCEEADFAVPFEEMFSKKPERVESPTPEARVPTESRCRSAAGPKHFNSSEEKRAPLPEVSSLSFDDAKQFNLSFSRTNAGSKNGMIGTTHIAQLHAVPGYTCLIDEQATQQVSDGGKAAQTTLKDARLNANSSEEIKERKASTKAVSGPQQQESIKITSSSNSEIPKKPRRHWSFANDISFDTFEMGLGTQPSKMSPSNIGSDIGSSIRSSKLKFGFRSDDIEGAAGSCSPPLLDEEIDANSPAAASAAAVRKAIEEAQKKISLAKELMERKKLGLQNHVKPSFANCLKAKRRDMKTLEQITRSREAQEMHLKDNSKQVFNSSTEQDTEKSSQAALNFSSLKETSFVKASIAESNSARVNCGLKTESRNSKEGFWMPAVGKGRDTALDINQEVSAEKTRLSASAIECKEKITEGDDIKKPMDGDKRLEVFEDKLKQEKFQRKINSVEVAFRWDIYRHNTESAEELSRLEENSVITQVVNNNAEAACESGITHLQEEYESRRLFEPEEDAEFVIQELEENIIRKETKDVVDQVGNEMRQREADYREEVEILSTEVPGEKNENRLAEIPRCEGNGRGQKEEFDRTDYEIRQQVYEENQVECFHQEENDQIQIGDPKPEVTGEYFRVHTGEVIGASCDNFQDEENSQKSWAENSGTESDGNLVDSTESENMLQEDYEMNEISKQNFYEDVESERILTAIHLWDHGQEVKSQGAEVTAEDAVVENERMTEQSYPKEETGRGSEVAEEADDGVEQDQVQTGDTEQGLFELDRSENQTADVYLGETDLMFDHQQIKYHVTEYERACKQGFPFEEVMSQSEENVKDVSDSEIGSRGQGSESNFSTHGGDRLFSNGIDSDTSCNSEKQAEEAVCGFGETDHDTKESQVPFKNDEDETYFESSSEEELAKNSIDIQAGQQPHIFESEEKIMSVSQEETEEYEVQVSLEGRTNQNMDKDAKYHEIQTTENRDTEDNLQKEVELGNKQHARKEEMRMRELKKEKEKERMAVERTIREVRERAFAEARERAERAAAKRTAAEAREMSEKVFPDTKSKLEVEKASVEAELRAQRAAVERATAEARERALEKALSEKASFKMRNQADKSATEYSGASRHYGIKPNDQQSNISGSSKSSATDGELAERCKATFERDQRTAERAAKALAEKNMRDLLAKKEQAERNRLAEILDAEVKRWSSGKERNLRALLSTLQYILGSDSGWQPVPLTDLISTAAVKKAYRKATLFVHPDKLQQRGASIQQKYTCEKVFDLLKDAWNKFSTEER